MKQRVADILLEELRRQGIGHVFMLSGGGVMYLADALGRSGIAYICCHHEQAAAIAAQAYAMRNNAPGVCLVTTGPGGVNALTGCAAAYVDSTPVLFLSGQVKTDDLAAKRNVRQFGAQENDIVSMAKPVCKYAVMVEDPARSLCELQKALYLALHGRRGPVWVDIPLDVQNAEVDKATLPRFVPEDDEDVARDTTITASLRPDGATLENGVDAALRGLMTARRPLMLVGHGVVAAGEAERFRRLAAKLGVPVQATWRGLGLLADDDPLFFGSPGLQAVRSANIITQGADFLLVLGSRLDNMITAFAEERFALRASKIIVDVDAAELAKLRMPDALTLCCDAGVFLERLEAALDAKFPGAREAPLAPWLAFCRDIKRRFPLRAEHQPHSSGVDLYRVAAVLAAASGPEDVIVASSTSRCNTAGHMAFACKRGQKIISSMGMGSMGFALPSALGAWFASGGKRVVMLEGDGSFQLNIQELQTVVHHQADIKMFIFSNSGYAAIATMQDRNFAGFHVGSDAESGVSMPDLAKIAAAYGIPFARISEDEEISAAVAHVLALKGPVICEVCGDIAFDEIPKCISSVNEAGKRVSAALENPWPFLDEDELAGIYAGLPL